MERSRGIKYENLQERTRDGRIKWDMFNYFKIWGESLTSELKSLEKHIWEPEFGNSSYLSGLKIG